MGLAESTTTTAVNAVKSAATDVQQELKSQSEQVLQSAKSQAEQYASERRDNAAAYARDVSEALQAACAKLEERGRGGAAHLIRKAADQANAVGDRVQGQDIGQVLRSVEDFARQRPMMFLGAAFLATYGLIRLFGGDGAQRLVASAERAAGEIGQAYH